MGNDERFSQDVLRAVFDRLDSVFPEFGFRRRREGWVATNEAFCRERFNVRCDRIVCNQETGFYIHGLGQSEHWLSYLNGGTFPRGAAWHEAATELARRVGMDGFARRAPAEESVWSRVVAAAQGQAREAPWAQAYLKQRGADESWGLGAITSVADILKAAGLSTAQARSLKVLTSAPGEDWWAGRVVGLVRDEVGEAVGLWGRATSPTCQGPRYLMGGVGSPAFYGPIRGVRVVLVEGFFDALRLKAHGESAVALGGTAVSEETLELLSSATEIVLCLDGDDAGLAGTKRLLRQLPTKTGLPPVSVVQLPVDSDIDEVLHEEPDAWPSLLRARVPWLTFVVRAVLEPVAGGDAPAEEQVALRRIGALCRAASVGWPAEVAVALREAANLVHVEERLLLRVLGTVSDETVS